MKNKIWLLAILAACPLDLNCQTNALLLGSETPRQAVLTFFSWYADHQSQMYKSPIFSVAYNKDGNAVYEINAYQVREQLQLLQGTGLCSRDYLWGKEQYLKQLVKNFSRANEAGKAPQEYGIDPILLIKNLVLYRNVC